MRRTAFLAIAIAMSCVSAEKTSAQADCGAAAECNAVAMAAVERGDFRTALSAYRLQVDFGTGEHAMGGGGAALICDGFENLARLSLKLGKPLRGNAWAQTAEAVCPPDPDLQAIVSSLANKTRDMPAADSIAGLYWNYAGYGEWNEITLIDHGNGHLEMKWAMKRYGLIRSAETDGPASTWDFAASGNLEGRTLIVRYPGLGSIDSNGNEYGAGKPCQLDFAVQSSELMVETDLPPECTNGEWGPYPRGTFWHVEAD